MHESGNVTIWQSAILCLAPVSNSVFRASCELGIKVDCHKKPLLILLQTVALASDWQRGPKQATHKADRSDLCRRTMESKRVDGAWADRLNILVEEVQWHAIAAPALT